MPIYEYQCGKCGSVFEVMQKFSDAPLSEHNSCGGPVERLLSAPAFQFKGSGWYITDYARSGSAGANGKGDGEKSGSESKADGASSQAKPEAKTESKAESKPAAATTS